MQNCVLNVNLYTQSQYISAAEIFFEAEQFYFYTGFKIRRIFISPMKSVQPPLKIYIARQHENDSVSQ